MCRLFCSRHFTRRHYLYPVRNRSKCLSCHEHLFISLSKSENQPLFCANFLPVSQGHAHENQLQSFRSHIFRSWQQTSTKPNTRLATNLYSVESIRIFLEKGGGDS